MDDYTCGAERKWELDLMRWEGFAIFPGGEERKTGIIRTTEKDALQDAERMAEEPKNGITGR